MHGMTTKRTKPQAAERIAKHPKSQVAERIRRAIVRGNKTRYVISQETGVEQSQLCRFVKGWDLGIDKLEVVAAALGLKIVVREIVVRPARRKPKG